MQVNNAQLIPVHVPTQNGPPVGPSNVGHRAQSTPGAMDAWIDAQRNARTGWKTYSQNYKNAYGRRPFGAATLAQYARRKERFLDKEAKRVMLGYDKYWDKSAELWKPKPNRPGTGVLGGRMGRAEYKGGKRRRYRKATGRRRKPRGRYNSYYV